MLNLLEQESKQQIKTLLIFPFSSRVGKTETENYLLVSKSTTKPCASQLATACRLSGTTSR